MLETTLIIMDSTVRASTSIETAAIPVIENLNHYASLITAAATAVVALFTVGTWKLYKIERERREARRGRMAARLSHLHLRAAGFIEAVRRQDFVLPEDDDKIDEALSWIDDRDQMLEELEAKLAELFDEASYLPPKVMANIDVGHSLVPTMKNALSRARQAAKDDMDEDFRKALESFHDCMRMLTATLIQAYASIPEDKRTWGDEEREYRDLFQKALVRSMGYSLDLSFSEAWQHEIQNWSWMEDRETARAEPPDLDGVQRRRNASE